MSETKKQPLLDDQLQDVTGGYDFKIFSPPEKEEYHSTSTPPLLSPENVFARNPDAAASFPSGIPTVLPEPLPVRHPKERP